MELQHIRQQFIELSGRYDLLDIVEESGECKADFFINAGVRVLDRKITAKSVQNSVAIYNVPSDVSRVQADRCWQVHEVWTLPSDGRGNRTRLHETRQTNRFQDFFRTEINKRDRHSHGFPLYYSILTTRNEQQLEKMSALSLDIPANYAHTGELNSWIISIELYPMHHAKCDIEVRGKFYSPPFTSNNSSNIWSQFYPDLLIKASCYVLETFYRNTEGANDWLSSILDELIDIEKMEVETDMLKYSVMEG